MRNRTEQLGFDFDSSPNEIESVTKENVREALRRGKEYLTEPIEGRLYVAKGVNDIYTAHTYRLPTPAEIRSGVAPQKLVKQSLPLEDQYLCQNLIKEIEAEDHDDGVLSADTIFPSASEEYVEPQSDAVGVWHGDPRTQKEIEPLLNWDTDKETEED